MPLKRRAGPGGGGARGPGARARLGAGRGRAEAQERTAARRADAGAQVRAWLWIICSVFTVLGREGLYVQRINFYLLPGTGLLFYGMDFCKASFCPC